MTFFNAHNLITFDRTWVSWVLGGFFETYGVEGILEVVGSLKAAGDSF